MNLTKRSLPKYVLAISAIALFTVGCSSPDRELLNQLDTAEKTGSYRNLYEKSKSIVDDPNQYDANTVQLAQDYLDRSTRVLKKHYNSTVASTISSGNYVQAITTYESSEPEIRQALERNFPLQEQLMRSYIELNDFARAREALSLMAAQAEGDEQNDKVADFDEKLERLTYAFDTMNAYRSQIIEASEEFGFMVDDTGVPSTHCSGTAQEDIIPDNIQELIDLFNELQGDYGTLKEDLGRPGSVRVATVLQGMDL
ncbi:MAG: hypothetical protein ACFCU1_05980 [Sumerlaeia bacterium]